MIQAEELQAAGRALARMQARQPIVVTTRPAPPSDYANRRALGLCTKCGLKAFAGMALCAPCGVANRERVRAREGWKAKRDQRKGAAAVYPGEAK